MGLVVIAALVLTMKFVLMSQELSFVAGDVGTAASYAPPYTPTRCYGYSADQFPPGNLFVAVGDGLWDNGAACGRRYRLRCLSGANRPCRVGATVDVTVVNYIPNSPSTILLSTDAFAVIARSPRAKINAEFIQI